jgi:hypothetical protein
MPRRCLPGFDWSTRWIMGMFAWIIDFLFYVMPLMIAGVLFFCVAFSAVLSNSPGLAGQLFAVLGAILALYLTFVFLSSVFDGGASDLCAGHFAGARNEHARHA